MSTLSNVETGRGQANPPSVRVLRGIEATEGRLAPDTIPEAKSSQTGVSVKYVPTPDKSWYVFRASYGREDWASDYIVEDGTFVYIAKRYVRKTVNGKQKKVLETLIPNLLFVYSPIFFRQRRTGLDGRPFWCYKFRSMHVNDDADRLQATKDDPRKFPFGDFMRKTNIDELPQFWNVLIGDMSIVGPRPHMLAHTEQYDKLIDKYMVRHFVKPGITGWAQVTGFRGETRDLWQMEGRVERDIWYIQHWSLWLDLRIIWLTFKTIFKRDKKAY